MLDPNGNLVWYFRHESKGRVVTLVESVSGSEMQNFVRQNGLRSAGLFAVGEHIAYKMLQGFPQHRTVKHRDGRYISVYAFPKSMKCIWAVLKRRVSGINHVVGGADWINALVDRAIGRFPSQRLIA
jgi:hypothetical protein